MKFSIKIALGLALLATIGIIATSGLASAFMGDPSTPGPNFDADIHAEKLDAFDNYDFAAWKELMESMPRHGRVLDVVNEDNFHVFVDARNAALDGDMETADALRAELGLYGGNGPRDGSGYGMQSERGQGLRDGRGQGHGMGQGCLLN